MNIRILCFVTFVGTVVVTFPGATASASADEGETAPASATRASGAVAADTRPVRRTGCSKARSSEPRQDRDCAKLVDEAAWTYDADDLARDVHAIEQKAPVDRGQRSDLFGRPARAVRLGAEIAKATRPDCRTAYQRMLLLAIPFLIKDTITGTGCKW